MYYILAVVCCALYTRALNLSAFLVFGPGLESDFIVPLRWIYIQCRENENKNISHSIGSGFSAKFRVLGTSPLNIPHQILDLHDGFYVLRYVFRKFFYSNVSLNLYLNGSKIGNSPYSIPGFIQSCKDCIPISHTDSSCYRHLRCSDEYTQMQLDFQRFTSIDLEKTKQFFEKTFFPYEKSYSICKYILYDQQVYKKCYGRYTGFSKFLDDFLKLLLANVRLPDVEFFFNLGDWPLIEHNVVDSGVSILSWCGSNSTRDIVVPTYESIMRVTAESRNFQDVFQMISKNYFSWKDKVEKGVFRGRDSNKDRIVLSRESLRNDDLIDAGITQWFFFRNEADARNLTKPFMNYTEMFKYKYLISLDGTVAAYRLASLLAGNSVVFKQDSPYYEHFYADLKPFVHYIPFKRNLSDLNEKINFAKSNDDTMRRISLEGQRFVRTHLTSNHIMCYYLKVFEKLSERTMNAAFDTFNMELVSDQKTHQLATDEL